MPPPAIRTALALIIPAVSGCHATTAISHTQSGASPTAAASAPRDPAPATNTGFRATTEAEFELLKKTVLFSDADARSLRMSRGVPEPHVDEILDTWYGFVGANDHLIYYFSHPRTRQPDSEYLARVRARFGQRILDTADANFDQAWLNRQLEFGLRHHRLKKNQIDSADSVDHIPFRHLVGLHDPIITTLKPFLARGGHGAEDVERMYEAWRKAVLLTSILWSQPYVEPRDF